MMQRIEHVLFGYYPYVCVLLLVAGSIWRFRREPYSWQASSSQLLRGRGFGLASNLFHVGVLALAGGHVMGLLVPAEWNRALGMSDSLHQKLELTMGAVFGSLTSIGLGLLIWRRLRDERIRATGSRADLLIVVLLGATLAAGLATLPFSFDTRDSGEYLHIMNRWVQQLLVIGPDAGRSIDSIPWVFKLHVLLGLGVFAVFPFTRLVHVCSAPLGYLLQRHRQIVRSAGL